MKSIHYSPVILVALAAVMLAGCPAVKSPAPTILAQAAAAEPKPVDKPAEKSPDKEASPAKSTDANPSAATRPKADRTPRKPGEPIRINFDHIILGMQKDMVFRPWMLNDDVKDLDGQKVSLTGVMYGIYEGGTGGKPIKWFVLLRNAECKYGPGGQADHLAEIELKPNNGFKHTGKTVRVEGTLKITPKTGKDGNTLSIYTIEDATAQEQDK